MLKTQLRNEKKSADQRSKSVSFDTSVAGHVSEKASVSRELRSSLFQNLNAVQHQMIDKVTFLFSVFSFAGCHVMSYLS